MFRGILISAAVAGVLAALVLTVLQCVLITPLILQAESYEDGAAAEAHSHELIAAENSSTATPAQRRDVTAHEHSHEHQHAASAEHHRDADEWKPADGLQRTLFTLASNIVMGFGYALLLTGVYAAWRRPTGLMQDPGLMQGCGLLQGRGLLQDPGLLHGLAFGLAGFAVFFVAPGLGLPPELPGTAAAELSARQQWWIGTAAASAIGLALLFMQKNIALRGVGIAAIIAPHLLGAPQPQVHASLAPEQLQNHFRWATTFGNAIFWLLLGAISALALNKFAAARGALD